MWHEFSISVYNKKLDDMGIDKQTSSKAMVTLEDISRFYKSFDQDDNEVTLLCFTDGDSMQVSESYYEVKQIMKPLMYSDEQVIPGIDN